MALDVGMMALDVGMMALDVGMSLMTWYVGLGGGFVYDDMGFGLGSESVGMMTLNGTVMGCGLGSEFDVMGCSLGW